MAEKFYKQNEEKILINVRVNPKASNNKIVGIRNDALLINVTVVPEKNKANEAIIKIISKELKISKSQITIMSGMKCKTKVICVQGNVDLQQLEKWNDQKFKSQKQ